MCLQHHLMGVNIMGNKGTKQELIERLMKKNKRNTSIKRIMGLAGLSGCMIGVLSMMVGACFALSADTQKNEIGKRVVETDGYQQIIREEVNELCNALQEGKISYVDFKKRYDTLYNNYAGYSFAKDNKISEYQNEIDGVEEIEQTANGLWMAGPVAAGIGVLSHGGAMACDEIYKFRKKKILLSHQ